MRAPVAALAALALAACTPAAPVVEVQTQAPTYADECSAGPVPPYPRLPHRDIAPDEAARDRRLGHAAYDAVAAQLSICRASHTASTATASARHAAP